MTSGASGELKRPSVVTLGCGRLGAFWQGRSISEGLRAVESALESGITSFDTADVYARGLSERLLGRALKGKVGESLVITKVGQVKTVAGVIRSGGWRNPRTLSQAVRGTEMRSGRPVVAHSWDPSYIRRAAAASARRLNRPRLDVVLLHGPEGEDRECIARALDALRAGRTAQSIGISCDTVDSARQATSMSGCEYLEIPIDPWALHTWRPVVESAAANGVKVLARSPFAGGDVLRQTEDRQSLEAACLRIISGLEGVESVIVGCSSARHVVELSAAVRLALSLDVEEARSVISRCAAGASS